MAPTIFSRLSKIGHHAEALKAPLLPTHTAIALSIVFTALYVLPFYFSPITRPSPTLSRDAPSVIRARIRFVSASVVLSTIVTTIILRTRAYNDYPAILHTLGLYPINLLAVIKSLLLTMLLFAGPIFEKGLAEGGWRRWLRGTEMHETLSSWIGWRNYVVGPLTEEVLFRSVILALHTHTKPQPKLATLIFGTPLYFGIAHVHHFYEYKLTHPYTTLIPAILRSVIQFTYTTLFGWYATFVFLRTGSLWAVFLIHALCNWAGLPRVWGRVVGIEALDRNFVTSIRGKEDNDVDKDSPGDRLSIGWTVAYYIVLIVGAIAWWQQLWNLTENQSALAEIRPQSWSGNKNR